MARPRLGPTDGGTERAHLKGNLDGDTLGRLADGASAPMPQGASGTVGEAPGTELGSGGGGGFRKLDTEGNLTSTTGGGAGPHQPGGGGASAETILLCRPQPPGSLRITARVAGRGRRHLDVMAHAASYCGVYHSLVAECDNPSSDLFHEVTAAPDATESSIELFKGLCSALFYDVSVKDSLYLPNELCKATPDFASRVRLYGEPWGVELNLPPPRDKYLVPDDKPGGKTCVRLRFCGLTSGVVQLVMEYALSISAGNGNGGEDF